MKHVHQLVISFFVIVYVSFLLMIFGFKINDFLKYLFMIIGALVSILGYFLIIKNIKWDNEIKQGISEEKKNRIGKRINRIKKIISFFVYSFMIICMILGLANDGEFHIKNIYPFFRKRFSDNEVFNWIIIICHCR